MSINPFATRIAVPYARALFEVSVKKNIMHQVTADFQSLETFFEENLEFMQYLKNALVSQTAKREILEKTLKSQIHLETFQFLMVLLNKNRIDLLPSVIRVYLELIYQTASVKTVQISTAFPFTSAQKDLLIQKLKELTKAREIKLVMKVDSSLIGGFLIQTESKVLDFTLKHRLQTLAQHLDTGLEI
jgi:F-type H+-transporting ATPase subunit delta